ncbi:ackA [Acrasis kona]|uniref:AckA n=1 Tax=Acrasis kona TaxID=1008807 RepID=A0AAW2YUN7_9EUKA
MQAMQCKTCQINDIKGVEASIQYVHSQSRESFTFDKESYEESKEFTEKHVPETEDNVKFTRITLNAAISIRSVIELHMDYGFIRYGSDGNTFILGTANNRKQNPHGPQKCRGHIAF